MTGSTIIPAIRYRDANAAIEWLCSVLGMTRNAVYPGPENTIAHAQLTYGAGMVMLGSASNGGASAGRWVSPAEAGGRETSHICIIMTDDHCRAAYERAKAAGAPIVQDLTSPQHGGLSFGCEDPEGHTWWVGSYDPWAQPAQK
jgi:uncharacterized glyoxalase superfamily protein PhnB